MEIRLYYKQKEIEKALKQSHVEDKGDGFSRYCGWGGFQKDDKFPELVHCTMNSTLSAPPSTVKDIKPVEVSLHDLLPPNENPHIKQGLGQDEQGNRFEVTCTARTIHHERDNEQYSTISVWIKGKELQQVLSCYDKIRKGELGGSWGAPAPEQPDQEQE